MLIHIINGTYGHRPLLPNGELSHYVLPVTRADAPIEVCDAEARRLIAHGIAEAVTLGTPAAVPVPEPEPEPEPEPDALDVLDGVQEVDLDAMTVPQLKAYAAENGIDLSGVTRKVDIIDRIRGEVLAPELNAEGVVE